MSKKITISEKYAEIIRKVKAGEKLTEAEIEFLVERKESVDAKNANRKQTATQRANEEIKDEILAFMEDGEKYTIGDFMKRVPKCEGMTNQRVSAIVRQLKEALLVVRTEEKGKAYFTKA